MSKVTIVYSDGYQEQYNMMSPKIPFTAQNILKRLDDIYKDGMIRIVLEDAQFIIIPLTNVRKIIYQTTDEELKKLKIKDYAPFLNYKFIDNA